MARAGSSETGMLAGLTLSDPDIITKRVYGRRRVLREFGAALLGASAIGVGTATPAMASCDSNKRQLGDKGQDRFADSNFKDPKTGCKKKK